MSDKGRYSVTVEGKDLKRTIEGSKDNPNCHWLSAALKAAKFLCETPGAEKVTIRDEQWTYRVFIKIDGEWRKI